MASLVYAILFSWHGWRDVFECLRLCVPEVSDLEELLGRTLT